MYNRYIPGADGYTRVTVEDEPGKGANHREQRQRHRADPSGRGGQNVFRNLTAPLGFLAGEDKNAGMAGILKSLHLEDLDSGDILLLLIILFLFLEGDNIELVITLGLMRLLGLGDEKGDTQKE